MSIVPWLYRLQQHIAITQTEASLLMGLLFLFLLGLGVRHIQTQPVPPPEALYQNEMLAFEQASQVPVESPVSAPPPTPMSSPAEASPPRSKSVPAKGHSLSPMNLNTATATELERLPRIGPQLAQRIILYRETHGPFQEMRALLRVRGIGNKTLETIQPYLFIEAPSP